MPAEHHPPPPVKVARRAAEQQQGGERQGEGVDHPLHLGGGGVEAAPDRRQRDVEHRAVDEGEARGEDAGGEDEARMLRRAAALPDAASAVAGGGEGEAQGAAPAAPASGSGWRAIHAAVEMPDPLNSSMRSQTMQHDEQRSGRRMISQTASSSSSRSKAAREARGRVVRRLSRSGTGGDPWTIGWGSTGRHQARRGLDPAAVRRPLRRHVAEFAAKVEKALGGAHDAAPVRCDGEPRLQYRHGQFLGEHPAQEAQGRRRCRRRRAVRQDWDKAAGRCCPA